ncbi:DUF4288 domain-containing protein [Bradyrhizobium sp. INPA03-11B]|uniref:DUF4288 domain-containing protein n=1 Tax=Bradyrhizobium sp. INPA03-11B TaxID=418598 RepID=UPI00338F1F4C
MKNDQWFSTKLRFVVMVEPIGGDTLNDCVYLLRATDFDAAFDRALSIGQASQKEYLNAMGQRVQWRFVEVISLDVIRSDNLDGCEVYSEPVHLNNQEVLPFEAEFSPETSKPIQTI